MKILVMAGTVLALAGGASYTSFLTSATSEASLLVFWGGALLLTARAVRVRSGAPRGVESRQVV